MPAKVGDEEALSKRLGAWVAEPGERTMLNRLMGHEVGGVNAVANFVLPHARLLKIFEQSND